MKTSNWVLSILVVIMITGLLAGCGNNSSNTEPVQSSEPPKEAEATPNTQPFKGTELRFVMAVHPWIDTLKPLIPEFEAETGIKVNLETYGTEQGANKVAVELTAKSKTLDVFFFRPLDEAKLYSQNGWLEPIDAFVKDDADFELNDFMKPSIDSVTYENQMVGLPITTEREILYYRKDIFEAKNIKVPTTMEEMMYAAEQLHDPANDFYGFVGRGKKVIVITQFSGYLHSFGGNFQENGKASVNTPSAIEAYKFYGTLLGKYGPPGAINMSWPEAAAAFAQGKVAMFTDADAIYLNVADPEKSKVSEQLGYAMFPSGPAGAKPYNVVSGALGISQYSENKEAAAEFIKWASSKETVLRTQTAGNPGARKSVWQNPDSTKNYPEDLVKVINQSSDIGVGIDRPQVINVAEARDIISQPITAAIEGKSVEEAADKAQKEFQALIDKELESK